MHRPAPREDAENQGSQTRGLATNTAPHAGTTRKPRILDPKVWPRMLGASQEDPENQEP